MSDLQRMLHRGVAVRLAVLENPSLPESDLLAAFDGQVLAGTADAVASNPAATGAVLRKAWLHASPSTQLTLRRHPNAPADLDAAGNAGEDKLSASVRTPAEVLADPAADPAELAALAFTKDERLRFRVAAHPNTPVRVLTGYLRLDHWALMSVVENPSLPEETIITRFREGPRLFDERAVLARLANRSPMSASFARFVLERWREQGGVRMVQRVPAALAANPAVPEEVLAELAASGDVDVVRAVAANSAASPATRRAAEVAEAAAAA
ncbi:hypothetical protein [Curtobacterium sp. MCBD17_040]|uniref:hypothetical protein n=1 Tax=Curtobacterium sp. MCBD17_040 TaxID=2175674 RepID=UPI000DA85644|nr:hypothetical protein [Curtobacterium sp. MCBD17_040]WIB65379.1 hypothetical protein DEI94_18400 [Curtobacterium sp. MCBD17_040]